MEEVYPRQEVTDIPEVFFRQAGRGRVVSVPGDIGRTFWEILEPDHLKLIRNAVEWTLDEPPIVSVEGPGVLDVTAWRQADSLTIHLVNLTNAMMMKGPARDLIPIGPQQVRLRLPEGTTPRRVHLLRQGGALQVVHANRVLSVSVPSILDHEVIALDL